MMAGPAGDHGGLPVGWLTVEMERWWLQLCGLHTVEGDERELLPSGF